MNDSKRSSSASSHEGPGVNLLRTYFCLKATMLRHSINHHRGELIRYGGFMLFFLSVSIGLFFLLYRAFSFFNSFEIVGQLVIVKLLSTIFFVFFMFLLLSNINSVIKWFFNKEDLPFLLTNPVPAADFFRIRVIESLFESSWAFIFFALPVLLAYFLVVSGIGVHFFLACLLLVPFVVIPHSCAVIAVMLLGRYIAPRAIRTTFSVLSLLMIAALVIVFRAIQIEKLARPESFAHVYEYMRFLELPANPLIPVNPFISAVVSPLRSGWYPIFLDAGFVVSTAAVLLVGAWWAHDRFFMQCYTNVRASSKAVPRDFLKRIFFFLPGRVKNIFLKELKSIQRDPKEWSQVFLILGLLVVYVYNFKLFPRDRTPLPTVVLESILAFLNMGLITFVISAIAVRFVYPAFQLEGRPFWILLTSPVSLKQLYVQKLLFYLLPTLALSFTLTFLSSRYMSTPPLLHYLSYGYVTAVSLLSPVLALYIGTRHINFREAPNPYGGMGGVTCMLCMMVYTGLAFAMLGPLSFRALFLLQKGVSLPASLLLMLAVSCILLFGGTLLVLHNLMVRTVNNLSIIEL
jgi:ABC-2 type transport system permease protein